MSLGPRHDDFRAGNHTLQALDSDTEARCVCVRGGRDQADVQILERHLARCKEVFNFGKTSGGRAGSLSKFGTPLPGAKKAFQSLNDSLPGAIELFQCWPMPGPNVRSLPLFRSKRRLGRGHVDQGPPETRLKPDVLATPMFGHCRRPSNEVVTPKRGWEWPEHRA